MPDMVLGEVELLEVRKAAQAGDLADLVLGQVQVFKVEFVQVLNFRNLVHAKGEGRQTFVAGQAFNFADLVVIEAQKLYVGIKADVFDSFNLVVRVVDNFEVSRGSEIEHLGDAIIARIQLNQVLNLTQVAQTRQ